MPGAAIEAGAVDLVLPLEDIAPALMKLVGTTSS
jgi:chemotaxis response regulator CheB